MDKWMHLFGTHVISALPASLFTRSNKGWESLIQVTRVRVFPKKFLKILDDKNEGMTRRNGEVRAF